LGEEHPDIASLYWHMSRYYGANGDFEKELELMIKSINTEIKLFGESNLLTASKFKVIGLIYTKNKKFDKALEYLQKCLEIQIKTFGENNLEITSLSLYTNSGQRWNLPSKGGNPKFRAFDIAQKPFKLQLERVQGMDWDDQNNPDIYTTINAFYDYEGVIYKLSVWVDEKNTNNTWTLFTKQ
jgi:tetratricopeptide (TPR) repeat protein